MSPIIRQQRRAAPGIGLGRDCGRVWAEFDLERFAGVRFDPRTRANLRRATKGLRRRLLVHAGDRDSDLTYARGEQRGYLIDIARRPLAEVGGAGEPGAKG